jgi:hypothetical protein
MTITAEDAARARELYKRFGEVNELAASLDRVALPSDFAKLDGGDLALYRLAKFARHQPSNERYETGTPDGANLDIGSHGIWRTITDIRVSQKPSGVNGSADVIYMLTNDETGETFSVTTPIAVNDRTRAWLNRWLRVNREEFLACEEGKIRPVCQPPNGTPRGLAT